MNTSELKKGAKLEIEGAPYVVVDFEFVKPGKGQGLYRCKLRNMTDGSTIDRTFRSDEDLDDADVSETEMQYLYRDGDDYWFMDTETYEQMFLSQDQLGEARNFLLDNALVSIMFHNGNPIAVTPPTFIEVAITATQASIKGATKDGASKPATIGTGHTITVPMFVEQGDVIRVDTRTGTYVERVRK